MTLPACTAPIENNPATSRYCPGSTTVWPSITANKLDGSTDFCQLATTTLAAFSRSPTVMGGGSSSAGSRSTKLIIGTSSGLPAGTWKVRVIGAPPSVPAMKNTGPLLFILADAPVVSEIGFAATGACSAQVHHASVQSAVDRPATVECGARTV